VVSDRLAALAGRGVADQTVAMEPYAAPTRNLPQLRADDRIGDLERGQVCDQLSAAFAEGRLTEWELDERLASAVSARTRRDVLVLTRDLGTPDTGPRDHRPPPPVRPTWTGLDILALLMLVGCSVVGFGTLLLAGFGDASLFFVAAISGSLAFAGGASATHLAHRSLRRHSDAISRQGQ
jgi:hypothetical protein